MRTFRCRRAAVTSVVALVAWVGAGVPVSAGDAEPTPIPPPGRTEVAGAHWSEFGLVAVSGGFVPGAGVEANADLLLFDLATGEWRAGPALPGPRDHAAMVVLDDSLHLVGGYTAGLSQPTERVFRLDEPDGEWREVAPMSTPRGAGSTTPVRCSRPSRSTTPTPTDGPRARR
jgi:Kelch motif